MLMIMIWMLFDTAKFRTHSSFAELYTNASNGTLLYCARKWFVISSIDFATPSLIAMDGTTTMNFVKPYCLFSSKTLRR